MSPRRRKLKIGIIGCGAIGTGIAKSIRKELQDRYRLNALYDIDGQKARGLARSIKSKGIVRASLDSLLKNCDIVVEAVNAKDTQHLIRRALAARKDVMVMSVGKLLNARNLFNLARKNNCHLLLPSGAIGGLDAVKAARLKGLSSITLTTRKPPQGLQNAPFLIKNKIDLSKIKKETTLFEGTVDEAVRGFPRNINVAATLALAAQARKRLKVRIRTSPDIKKNSHEIEATGAFGRLTARTENVPSPDNPKTSYLAVLSGIQTLKQFYDPVKVGT